MAKKKYYSKKKGKKSYSSSQKKSWLAGFFSGLRSKKKKAIKSTKRKSSNSNSKYSKYNSQEWRLAEMYADHMGWKFNLSKDEIKKNTENHYKLAKTDAGFFNFLLEEYGGRL